MEHKLDKSNNYVIYKTINLLNGKIYIGRDKNNNKDYFGSGILITKVIKKYGKENFKKEIIESNLNRDKANEREKYWILELKSRDSKIGYNLSLGGDGGITLTENEYKKLRQEQYQKDPTLRSRVSRCGNKNGMYGNTHSKEVKDKIRKSRSLMIGENHPNFGGSTSLKGKTYDEIYGIEKSNQLKKDKSEFFIKLRKNKKWKRIVSDHEKEEKSNRMKLHNPSIRKIKVSFIDNTECIYNSISALISDKNLTYFAINKIINDKDSGSKFNIKEIIYV